MTEIGTPNSPTALRVLLLGSGELGKEVAIVNPDPIGKAHDFLLRHTPFGHARAIEPLCMLWCIPGMTRGSWTHAFKLLRK